MLIIAKVKPLRIFYRRVRGRQKLPSLKGFEFAKFDQTLALF